MNIVEEAITVVRKMKLLFKLIIINLVMVMVFDCAGEYETFILNFRKIEPAANCLHVTILRIF